MYKFLFLILTLSPIAQADDVVVDQNGASIRLLNRFQAGTATGTYRVNVENCANAYTAVKIRVIGAAVSVLSAGVRYADGDEKTFPINKSYSDGTESRWLNLNLFRLTDPRCVAQVFTVGNTLDGTATIELWGRLK